MSDNARAFDALAPAGAGTASQSFPDAYAPSLDLLRIIACGAVMQFHMPSLGNLGSWVRAYNGAGYLGVDLFMLISGWLIGGQLIRERLRTGTVDLRRFYFKRWMRTLPPYYVMLVVLCVGQGWLRNDVSPGSYLLHFTFLQQYLTTNQYAVSWSLCVEEHFYLLCPLVVAAALRVRRLSVVTLSVAVVSALSLVARSLHDTAGIEILRASKLTHERMDGLWIGLLLAFVAHVHPAVWARAGRFANVVGVLGLVLAAFLFHDVQPGRYQYVWETLVGTLVLSLIFFACVQRGSLFSRIRLPGLRFLGELTFPLYLTHNVLPQEWSHLPLPGGALAGLVWRLAIVFAAAMALQFFVIDPAMKLRARLLRRSVPARAMAIAA